MKSNVAISYLVLLTIVGYFLWVIRNFIRGLKQQSQYSFISGSHIEKNGSDAIAADWPVHIFLDKSDDVPIPGKLVSVSASGASMESSACLKTGQEISVYIDGPGQKQVRVTAYVAWARSSRDGRNLAQLSFTEAGEGINEMLLVEN